MTRITRPTPPTSIEGDDENTGTPIVSLNTRRRALMKVGMGAWLVPAVGATTLLTACGSDDDDDHAPETPPAPAEPTPQPTPTPPVVEQQVSSFGLIVLPDTQFYSRYATESTGNQFDRLYGSEPFLAQTKWIAQHAKTLNVPFVIHVGDVVDQAGQQAEWEVADTALQALENGMVPYSILAGNHDIRSPIGFESDPVRGTDADRDPANEPYLQWFSPERAARQGTFGGRDASGFHEYHIFEAAGQRFLVLSLSWRASDAAIVWARDVLQAHASLPTILVNHDLISIDRDGVSPLETPYGLMLWNRLIKSHDQIFMTLNGHFHGSAHLTKLNAYGNPVEQMVVDYQMAYQGGNGLMRFFELDFTNNQIKALTFSPWVPQKPGETLNEFDQAMLTEPNHQFIIEMDFAKRFARFHPTFAVQAPTHTSLAAAATALVLDGFEDATPPVKRPAANEQDYPKIAETVAHWRFTGGAVGTAVAASHIVSDLSGSGNDVRRGGLQEPAGNTAQVDDLVWSEERHPLSAATGSVNFLNTAGPRLSYFLTDAAAPLNRETFQNGYTVEAFVQIGKGWTAQTNAWMNIMARGGRRGNLPGFQGGLPQSPPVQFAISNLREVQWEVIPQQPEVRRSRTNWSGEILIGTWLHIAVVNDPVAGETVMYVEGAPVLRNALQSVGLASLDLPWAIGAGFWDGGPPGSGFLGAISEIRMVARPLAPSQWLTARVTP